MEILYYENPTARVVRYTYKRLSYDILQQYCPYCDKWIAAVSWWDHKEKECVFQPDVGVCKYYKSSKNKGPDFRDSASFLFAAVGGMFGCFIPWLGVILLVIGFSIPLVFFRKGGPNEKS